MSKLIIIVLLFSITLLSTPSFSLELKVEVQKIKALDKKIMMELFLLTGKESQNWQELLLIEKRMIELDPEQQNANPHVVFSQLKAGHYALRVFQDLNNNNLLDKSSNNIPLEPIGFSSNPSLFSGEPSPEDSVIALFDNKTILVNLKHRRSKKKHKKRH